MKKLTFILTTIIISFNSFSQSTANSEDSLWFAVKKKNYVGAYQEYVEKYPNGKYLKDAEKLKSNLYGEFTDPRDNGLSR